MRWDTLLKSTLTLPRVKSWTMMLLAVAFSKPSFTMKVDSNPRRLI
jgi:hypothetical protein